MDRSADRHNRVLSLDDVLIVLGLTFLWPCLHGSSYYPISLTNFGYLVTTDAVINFHTLYSVVLLAVFIVLAIILVRRRLPMSRALVAVLGVCGCAGQALLVWSGDIERSAVLSAISVILVAFFIATAVVLWGKMSTEVGWARTSGTPRLARISAPILTVILSYALAMVLSALCLLIGSKCFTIFVTVCPLISMVFAFLIIRRRRRVSLDASDTAPAVTTTLPSLSQTLHGIPWSMVVPCLIFVFFGVCLVRVLVGESAEPSNFTLVHRIATSLFALVIICLVALCFFRASSFEWGSIISFVVIAVVYMGALLVMVTLYEYDLVFDKRALVAAEHCFEVLIWILIAHTVASKRMDAAPFFAIYGVLVVALPWFISGDIAQVTGLIAFVENNDMAVPVITVVLFAAAIASCIMLVIQVRRADEAASENAEDRLRELCMRATEGAGLTAKEFDVILYVYRGYSAKAIADLLSMSEHTVRSHTMHAYRKLDVHSKQELIYLIDAAR